MEQEVQLKAIKSPTRATEEEKDESWKVDPRLYPYMYNTVRELRNAVVTHLVTGKPLKITTKR